MQRISSIRKFFCNKKKGLKARSGQFPIAMTVKAQLTFTCSNLTIETLEKGVKHVQS